MECVQHDFDDENCLTGQPNQEQHIDNKQHPSVENVGTLNGKAESSIVKALEDDTKECYDDVDMPMHYQFPSSGVSEDNIFNSKPNSGVTLKVNITTQSSMDKQDGKITKGHPLPDIISSHNHDQLKSQLTTNKINSEKRNDCTSIDSKEEKSTNVMETAVENNTAEAFDDVDGAMFSRISTNLDQFNDYVPSHNELPPNSQITHNTNNSKYEKEYPSQNAEAKATNMNEGLDDVDGSMFSRVSTHLEQFKDVDAGVDSPDTDMFSRVPSIINNVQLTRSRPLTPCSDAENDKKCMIPLDQCGFYLPPTPSESQESLTDGKYEFSGSGEIVAEQQCPLRRSPVLSIHVDTLDGSEKVWIRNGSRNSMPRISGNFEVDGEGHRRNGSVIRVSNINNDDNISANASGDNGSTIEDAVFMSRANSLKAQPPTDAKRLPSRDGTLEEVNALEQMNLVEPTNTGFKKRYLRSVILPIFSLVLFFADLGSDIKLAMEYQSEGRETLFYITLGCIVIPAIIMSVVDLSWIRLDNADKDMPTHTKAYFVWRIPLGILSLGRVVRALSHIRHVLRSKYVSKRAWHKKRALEEKRDCFMLDFINAFTESCPQLFVQVYLWNKFDLPLTFLRVFSMLTSWMSIAWTYAAYYRCHRESLSGRTDVTIVGLGFYFISVLSSLVARVACAALFLVYFDHYIGFIVLLSHFILMLGWILVQKPELEGLSTSCCGRTMYCFFFAFVSVVCFVNLKKTKSRNRMLVFYGIVYIENIVFCALVVWQMSKKGDDPMFIILALGLGFIFHVILLTNYYKLLHPTTGACFNCDRDKGTNDAESAIESEMK